MIHRGIRHLRALSSTLVVVTVVATSVVVATGPVATVSAADAPWTLPTVPPRCSNEQANSGDVAGCILSSDSGLPEDLGWPTPPFPGEAGGGFPGTGWQYNGSSYNGSPALAEWEASFVSNSMQIGSVRPGQFSTQPDALPLYIGFLTEVQTGGYVIHNGTGAYSFRCTASTRKDCRGLTLSSLSNHAYGLASDINTTANPMQTQTGIDGASSCATPITTDMPRWVIQTAEKWGLYWGGYGWSGGCSSPDQFKTSSSRDPMHFEFNGSVKQARAILCHNLGYTAKFETVTSDGNIEDRCFGPNIPPAGTRMVIHTNAPAGATAALVNLTGANSSDNGYFTAESCTTNPSEMRAWSNGNTRVGRAVAAAAIVPLDSLGRFCLYNSTSMHSMVDVQGFFAPSGSAPDGALYTPITPTRTVDTRQMPFCTPGGTCTNFGPVPAGTEVASVATAPVDAIATLANLTVIQPSANGYLTTDGCDALQPGPQTHSNINFVAGDIVANLSLSPSASTVDGEQFCAYSQTSLHELVDVQGFFAPFAQGGYGYTTRTPERVIDTRQCWIDALTLVKRCGELNAGGDIIHIQAPAGAKAVVINLTTVAASRNGAFVSAGPCSVVIKAVPTFSNVNTAIGSAVANAAIVPVDPDGSYCVYVSDPMHVLVDLMGTFEMTGLRFLAITPHRVHDSRATG